MLSHYLAGARIMTIPNALTETSNLLVQGVADPLRFMLLEELRVLTTESEERYAASLRAAARREFLWLGLTDAAWLDALAVTEEFLTVDLKLFVAAQAVGISVVNFNHLRDFD